MMEGNDSRSEGLNGESALVVGDLAIRGESTDRLGRVDSREG